MITVLPPPTEAEEYRNMAEILRDLAAQVRFGKTRNQLIGSANQLTDWLRSPSNSPRLRCKPFEHHLTMARLEPAPTPL